VKFRDAYSGGAKLVFAIPKYAGLGAHWSLEDDEANDLGDAIHAFVKTLPASKRKAWEKRLEKYFPAINLAVVAGMLTIPRALATVELAKMQRAERVAASLSPSPSNGNSNGAGPVPTAHDLRDVTERYTQGPASNGPSVPTGGAGEVGDDDGSERN
jgi:hypothetical protein